MRFCKKKLEHNSELAWGFFKIGIHIPSMLPKQIFEHTEYSDRDSEKLEEIKELEDIEKPSENATPPYLWKINLASIVFILLATFTSLTFFRPNANQINFELIQDCKTALKEDDKRYWKITSDWPPEGSLSVVFMNTPRTLSEQDFLGKLDAPIVEEKDIIYLKHSEFSENFIAEQPPRFWLSVESVDKGPFLRLRVTYWSPQVQGIPVFEWERSSFLYWHAFVTLPIVLFLTSLIRYNSINSYRNRLWKKYEEAQEKRTKKIFEAKSDLEEARTLAQKGKLAQALVIANNLLKSIHTSQPMRSEVVDLKNAVLAQIQLGGGAITVSSLIKRSESVSSNLRNPSKLLYLRILGTPYVYQAPYGLRVAQANNHPLD